MIPDEDLKQILQETSDSLEELANTEKALTEEEKKYRGQLLRRQQLLTGIKDAKARDQKDLELYHTTIYNMMVPWGEKHPFLFFFTLLSLRMKWGSGSFLRFR